ERRDVAEVDAEQARVAAQLAADEHLGVCLRPLPRLERTEDADRDLQLLRDFLERQSPGFPGLAQALAAGKFDLRHVVAGRHHGVSASPGLAILACGNSVLRRST